MAEAAMSSLANWTPLWSGLGASPAANLHAELLARYAEPQRHYHTLQHLNECLHNFTELAAIAERPLEVALALWFHDAIYDIGPGDNEARSADWASAAILDAGLPSSVADRVHALIMATRHDAVPEGVDAQILVDVDLWILGAPAERFDEYERQIRQEYFFIPEAIFQQKRLEILQHFLARPRIFSTPVFFERYESRARDNLRRSIQSLAG